MKFDTVIIGGGLSGLICGICLQRSGQQTAIISMGQNALHFFSGSFESIGESHPRFESLCAEAGIPLHYSPGVRLMPMGSFRPAALSLEDVDIFPTEHFADKVLVVNFSGYYDFFTDFLAQGLEQQGIRCRIREISFPGLLPGSLCGERRAVHIARAMDRSWQHVVQEIASLLQDEDAVVLPQVFGLKDPGVPAAIRSSMPARVVFAGTLPPSVPGMRTQMLLKKRYQLLGGTFLMGDEAVCAQIHEGRVHSIATRNLDSNHLQADRFVLASGHFFSKGLTSNPNGIYEPVFGLDVDYAPDRNDWYDPAFAKDQPYIGYGVRTDAQLHAVKDGQPLTNLYAAGSVLGNTRPEFGCAAGQAVRSAFAVVDQITQAL